MAELATLARPYANAVFALAKDGDRLDQWSRSLRLLAEASANAEVGAFIKSPGVSVATKAHKLYDMFRDELGEDERRFLLVLAENHRLSLLPEIAIAFEERRAEESQSLDVAVTTAVETTDAERVSFQSALERRFGKSVKMTTDIDESLIAGALIRAGDTVIDASVRGKLEKMRDALLRS